MNPANDRSVGDGWTRLASQGLSGRSDVESNSASGEAPMVVQVGDTATELDTSPVRSCAGKDPISEQFHPGESASIKTVVNQDYKTVLLENCSLYLNFAEIMDICSAFGTIERIQIKPRTSSNSF